MKSMGHVLPKSFTCASYWQALLLKAAQQAGLAPRVAPVGHAAFTSSYEIWEKSVGQESGKRHTSWLEDLYVDEVGLVNVEKIVLHEEY